MTSHTPTTLSPYLIDGILPRGEVSILAGASGAGKSTLLMQLIAAIQAGETTFLGHAISYPIRIAYIAADRTWASYRELAMRVNVDPSIIQVRSVVDDDTIDADRFEHASMELLYSLICSFDHPDLVVVDPLIVFLGCDPNRYNQVAPRLIKMNRWCRRNSFTLLGTHHATKARSDYSFKRPQDRVSGSSALLGFTSTQLFLASAEEIGKPYCEWTIVPHNRPAETIKLVRNASGLLVPWKPAVDANKGLVDAVARVIATEALPKAAIAKATRIDPATLNSILTYMVQAELVSANREGQFSLTVKRES